MSEDGKKVLIVGSCATAYTLAKQMSTLSNVNEIFVAPGNDAMKDFALLLDIRENNSQELLEFVLESAIDLTIVVGENAIKKDISTLFGQNNQLIFCPSKDSAFISLNKSNGKKFMYKNSIPCPRFGIFDKPQMAFDYLNKITLPVVIKTEEHQDNGVLICNSLNLAKNYVTQLFDTGEKRVLIEDYVLGHEFSFYVITDGYHALPLGCVATYKYELEGNGGLLSSGMGAFVDDYTISNSVKDKIMRNIIFPTLNALDKSKKPYVGILGVDLVIDRNEKMYVIEFNSFLKSPDSQCILPLINKNLYKLFEACAIGSFADDYDDIDIKDFSSLACVVSAQKEGKVIQGLECVDDNTDIAYYNIHKNSYLEYETIKGRTLVLSRTAKVLSNAIDEIYEDLELIKFDGIKYRKDIGKII